MTPTVVLAATIDHRLRNLRVSREFAALGDHVGGMAGRNPLWPWESVRPFLMAVQHVMDTGQSVSYIDGLVHLDVLILPHRCGVLSYAVPVDQAPTRWRLRLERALFAQGGPPRASLLPTRPARTLLW